MSPTEFPQFVVTPRRPAYRRQAAVPLPVLLLSVVLPTVITAAMNLGSSDVLLQVVKPLLQTPRTAALPPRESERPMTRVGSGAPATQVQQVRYEQVSTGNGRKAVHKPAAVDRTAKVNRLIGESLKAARQGLFVKANDLAQDALQLQPDHQAAKGAWYLAAYAKQYTDLADEALSRLNSANTDVYLGPKYGRGAFVERDGDVVSFRCKGGKQSFTLQQLNSMDGVRFRITRQYLDNADNPANHLILAGMHYLKCIDEKGSFNAADPAACLDAAMTRCSKAVDANAEASGHAKDILALLVWLKGQPSLNDVATR